MRLFVALLGVLCDFAILLAIVGLVAVSFAAGCAVPQNKPVPTAPVGEYTEGS